MTQKSDSSDRLSFVWMLLVFGTVVTIIGKWAVANDANNRARAEKVAEMGLLFRQKFGDPRAPGLPDPLWDELSAKTEWGEKERQQAQSKKDQALFGRRMEEYWQWTDLEARHGNIASALLLGRALQEGKLLHQDKKKALEWFRLAAESNDPTAIQARDSLLAELGQ
jgi:TPR repeat protein